MAIHGITRDEFVETGLADFDACAKRWAKSLPKDDLVTWISEALGEAGAATTMQAAVSAGDDALLGRAVQKTLFSYAKHSIMAHAEVTLSAMYTRGEEPA